LLQSRFPGVTVLRGDAYNVRRTLGMRLTAPVAGVVSSLPLLTKPVSQRLALIRDCFEVAAPDAPFIQFTYGVSSPIPLAELGSVVGEVSPVIWWNLPPARVWVYRDGGDISLDSTVEHRAKRRGWPRLHRC